MTQDKDKIEAIARLLESARNTAQQLAPSIAVVALLQEGRASQTEIEKAAICHAHASLTEAHQGLIGVSNELSAALQLLHKQESSAGGEG